MAKKKISVMAFDNGEEFDLPKPIIVDPESLNSNPALSIAQIMVRELNALGYKVSWRRSNRKVEKCKKTKAEVLN